MWWCPLVAGREADACSGRPAAVDQEANAGLETEIPSIALVFGRCVCRCAGVQVGR